MGAREALKKHLLGEASQPPEIVTCAPEHTEGLAVVTIGRMRARVTLAGPDGDLSLLNGARCISRWALPPGSYRLRDSRVETEQDGVWWFLSSSAGPGLKPIELKANSTTKLDPGVEIHFAPTVKRQADGLILAFGLQTADQRGQAIFRDGQRIIIRYQLLDADGGVLAEGPFKYG